MALPVSSLPSLCLPALGVPLVILRFLWSLHPFHPFTSHGPCEELSSWRIFDMFPLAKGQNDVASSASFVPSHASDPEQNQHKMVTTRSHDHDGDAAPSTGEKRATAAGASGAGDAAAAGQGSEPKKQKTEHHGSERSGHHHERKVVVEPGEGQAAPKQEEGADVKKEEETPAPKEDQPASATASKIEAKPEEQDTKEESKSEPEAAAEEGNAEEGQVPQHEPNPDPERKHGVLERGHIYFLYRPKVQVDHPASLDDVSKFHILLVPHGTKFHRLIAVGKKALPEASESTRPIWGEVLNVGEDLKALKEGLGSYTVNRAVPWRFEPALNRTALSRTVRNQDSGHPPPARSPRRRLRRLRPARRRELPPRLDERLGRVPHLPRVRARAAAPARGRAACVAYS